MFLPIEVERESSNLSSNRATLKESNIAYMRYSESTVSFKIDFSMLGYIYLGLAVTAENEVTGLIASCGGRIQMGVERKITCALGASYRTPEGHN